ncbi:hypothetical protein AAFF_G00377810 [Aldrovandia affinis]|uniref:Uncharacterized protein n=1 Tax=Aldrovandia affinis TaxID=143900 RepID=A0AAD7SFW1_9TELE|nr:hypothetical protein AAFF_G00377810 [Aldrovandia affinis]
MTPLAAVCIQMLGTPADIPLSAPSDTMPAGSFSHRPPRVSPPQSLFRITRTNTPERMAMNCLASSMFGRLKQANEHLGLITGPAMHLSSSLAFSIFGERQTVPGFILSRKPNSHHCRIY